MEYFDLEQWDKIAETYSTFTAEDIFRNELLYKTTLELLGDIKGKRVLDAGCGDGLFTKKIAESGALVSGIDGSSKLIEIARTKYGKVGIDFKVADLRQPLLFPENEFDVVVSNMVLMDFDPIEKTLQEINRTLRPSGVFIFSILHPSFSRGVLRKTILERLLYKPPHYDISRYKTIGRRLWRISGMPTETTVYDRPLEFYSDRLKTNGFLITDIREPVFDKQFALKKNNFIKLCAEIPPFLIIGAEKR